MNLFAQMAKRLFEGATGRIQWRSNMWALIGGVWDKNRCVNPRITPDMLKTADKKAVLVHRRCVPFCPHPPRKSEFYKGNVPASVCRKCPYHQVATRQFRYPRCLYRVVENPEHQVTQQMTQIVSNATVKASEFLK